MALAIKAADAPMPLRSRGRPARPTVHPPGGSPSKPAAGVAPSPVTGTSPSAFSSIQRPYAGMSA